MYDLPAVRVATDAWWAGIARHLRAAGVSGVPERLTRQPTPAWSDPRLLFSQTCGYPLTHGLRDTVSLIATPVYGAPGCNAARYASALVVAGHSGAAELADLRGARCAINARDSHSGYNVLRYLIAPLAHGQGFFRQVLETGSHARSLAAVAAGDADVCAVDGVTHALLAHHEPTALAGTRVLMHSPQAPGLPYIAGPGVAAPTRACLRLALDAALADPDLAKARAALLIKGAAALPHTAYHEITDMERAASEANYTALA